MSAKTVRFKQKLQATFGDDFVAATESEWGEPYELNSGDMAIPFTIAGLEFRLVDKESVIDSQYFFYDIDLIANCLPKITEEIAIPFENRSTLGDRVLLFHSLVSSIAVDYRTEQQEVLLAQQLRKERNREIPQLAIPTQRPTGEDHLLPGTSFYQNDWECQLVLAYAQAGFEPKEAIVKAKSIVYLQLHSKNAEPGSFSIFENRKPSIDQ